MQIAIISTALGIVFFLCFLYAFKTGLRLAKAVSEGKDIPKTKNPITAVTEAVQEYKKSKEQTRVNKEYMDELNAILNYTGDIPKEE